MNKREWSKLGDNPSIEKIIYHWSDNCFIKYYPYNGMHEFIVKRRGSNKTLFEMLLYQDEAIKIIDELCLSETKSEYSSTLIYQLDGMKKGSAKDLKQMGKRFKINGSA